MEFQSKPPNLIPRAGLIGYPLNHTLSPHLYRYWLDHYGLEGKYEGLEIEASKLGFTIRACQDQGWRGLNVTIPYKINVLNYCHELSPLAREVGAVNMLCFKADGKIYGDNSDVYGFCESLRSHPHFSHLNPPSHKALLIGTGGAGRAVLSGLVQLGFQQIILANRTKDSAQALAKDYAMRYPSLQFSVIEFNQIEAILSSVHYVVNCTNMGMKGQTPLYLPLQSLPSSALVHDIVYNPLKTELLKQAEERGLATLGGLEMLMYQGQPVFHQWFANETIIAEVTPDLRQTITQALGLTL